MIHDEKTSFGELQCREILEEKFVSEVTATGIFPKKKSVNEQIPTAGHLLLGKYNL